MDSLEYQRLEKVVQSVTSGETAHFVPALSNVPEINQAFFHALSQLLRAFQYNEGFFNSSKDILLVVDYKNSFIISCNDSLATKLGYMKSELIGQPLVKLYSPELLLKKNIYSFSVFEKDLESNIKLSRKDGSLLSVSSQVEIKFGLAGEPVYAQIRWSDAAEARLLSETTKRLCELESLKQKSARVEAELRLSQQRLRSHLNRTPLAAIAWDLSYNITEWNPAAESLFGYSAKEAIGQDLLSLLVPVGEQKVVRQLLYEDLVEGKGGHINVNRNICKNGGIITCQWGNSNIIELDGAVIGGAAFAQNIEEFNSQDSLVESQVKERTVVLKRINSELQKEVTLRKATERTLREAEENYENLLKALPVGVFKTNLRGECTYINQQGAELLGLSAEEVLGVGWTKYLHPEDKSRVWKSWENALLHSAPIESEHRFSHANGIIKWVIARACPVSFSGQKIREYVGTLTDITQRKEMQAALEESESAYHAVFESIHDGILILSISGSVLDVNAAYCDMLLYTREECFSLFVTELIDEQIFQNIPKLWAHLRLHHGVCLEGVQIRKNGERMPVDISIAPLEYHRQDAILVSVKDLSKAKLAEEELRNHRNQLAHISRLNTVGEMVSGIAHEVNQPLATIVNYTAGCLERMQADGVSQELLGIMEQIKQQAERAGAIMNRLKGFLSKGTLIKEKQVHTLNEVVSDVIFLLECEQLANRIPITLMMAENLPTVLLDKIQVEQVLLNILHNAREALLSEQVVEPHILIKTYADESNHTLHISIEDNGIGLPDGMLSKISEPFFTTKESGMGIGLSISHSIIEAHHGRIAISKSQLGGLLFDIILPAFNKELT